MLLEVLINGRGTGFVVTNDQEIGSFAQNMASYRWHASVLEKAVLMEVD